MMLTAGKRIFPRSIISLTTLLLVQRAFAAPAPYSQTQNQIHEIDEKTIRVRIAEGTSKAEIRGFDLKVIEQGKHIVASPDRSSVWEFHCQDGRIRATQDGGRTLELKEPVQIQSQAGFLHYHGKPYRDDLRIYSAGSLCEVVNVLNVEKYLDGLVNAEFSSRWNEEAVSAQVIAARTYAVYQMRAARSQNPPSHYDLDSTDRDQVYDGTIREDARATQLVSRSRGMILSTPNSMEPIKAFYHSTCGGRTELPEAVWGKPHKGFKRSVLCPFCRISPRYEWKAEYSLPQMTKLILTGAKNDGAPSEWPKEWVKVLTQGKLEDVRVMLKDQAQRVAKVHTLWSYNRRFFTLPMTGSRFREWLGAGKLFSSRFDVAHRSRLPSQNWIFEGRGFGHGVGMCQWGAKGMGDQGYKMVSILRHYYPDAVLRKLW